MSDKDWYAVLGVSPAASTEEIADVVERQSRQAAAMANTAPERAQQLREQIRAIKADLLSGAEKRQSYDERRNATSHVTAPALQSPRSAPPPAATYPPSASTASPTTGRRRGGRFLQFLQTGWTCPSCGEGAMPSDKFCPRCGAEIPKPTNVRGPAACARCGTTNPPTNRFCTKCGAPTG